MTSDFHALSDGDWYGAAYFLTAIALQPTWGKIFKIFKVKETFIIVVVIFAAGSLLCATAPDSIIFTIGRAIAGLASGGVFTGSITIIAYSVPLSRQASYTGAFGALFGVPLAKLFFPNFKIAGFVGPLLGGLFTDKATWRWCFYINLPLSLITIAGIFFFLQNSQAQATSRTLTERLNELDYIGPAFIPAIVCLLLALQWGGSQYQWNSGIIVGLICGFGTITAIWMYSQYRLGEKATIPVRLITQRTIFFSSLYAFFLYASFVIPTFYLPLYFQVVKGTTETASGIHTLPLIIAVTVAAAVGGILVSIVGYVTPFMIVGTTMFTVGVGLLSTLSVNTRLALWLSYQVIAGLGIGMNLQVQNENCKSDRKTPNLAVQTVISLDDVPVAVALVLFFTQAGSAIFIAIGQAVLLNKLLPQMQAINQSLTVTDLIHAGAVGLVKLVPEVKAPAVMEAYASSLNSAFLVAVVAGSMAVIAGFGVEWKTLKKEESESVKA